MSTEKPVSWRLRRSMFFIMVPGFPAAGAAVLIFFSLLSCATHAHVYEEVDTGVSAAFYSEALSRMEKRNYIRLAYPKRNAVLFYLDRGMIKHYAGLWDESSQDLEQGEILIEAAFTKSISQELSTFLLNDNTRDYPGEDYEDLYINVFNSLNYYHQNNLEGALVEIRRVNEKLNLLADKYERATNKVLASNADLGAQANGMEAVKFSNSALARYLGLLFYRANGDADDARIDLEELYRAYELAPLVYDHRPPSSLEEELSVPLGKARLNILAFTGLSPAKEEVNILIPLPLPPPNDWTRLALPRMADRPSAIQSVEVILTPSPSGRNTPDLKQQFRLEILENMSTVARETFKARYALTVLKSTARTITKTVTTAVSAQALREAARKNDSAGAAGFGALVDIFGKVFTVLSEQADLRISRYFPARALAGGINLDPGIYTIQVNYYGLQGLIAADQQDNVLIQPDKLNLAEFVCLK